MSDDNRDVVGEVEGEEAPRLLEVTVDRSGQTPSPGMLAKILSSLASSRRLPKTAAAVIERLLDPPTRILQQRSTLQLETAGRVITVKLPLAYGNQRGATVFPAAVTTLGPGGKHLYLSLGQFRVPGKRQEPPMLARLELPLKHFNKMEVLWTDSEDTCVLDTTWHKKGLCVMSENPEGANWARLIDWSGNLVWKLTNADMPGVEYLDYIAELQDNSYLLICTMTDHSVQFLTWDPEARTVARWRHCEAMNSFCRELSGKAFFDWMRLAFLPVPGDNRTKSASRPTFEAIFMGHYEIDVPPAGAAERLAGDETHSGDEADGEEVDEEMHCMICHLRWSDDHLEVLNRRDLRETFADQASLTGGLLTISPRIKEGPQRLVVLDGTTLDDKEDLTMTFVHDIDEDDDDYGMALDIPYMTVME
mmetsp:Transcript_34175/g.72738  ORF Transcript_34175/g.72738 Transcript_34175/m.72738 type:complete len:420 (-) Transcript_34175:53-1312(-)